MPEIAPSTKQQIVLTAERLFAERGIEGVSLRQIGARAGNGNNSAVQYHFGSKDQLIQAIFEYRMPRLQERRQALVEQRRPRDLRSWVECYVLPILEQGEQKNSHYLAFVAMLHQHGRRDVFERVPEHLQASTRTFRAQMDQLLAHIPEPLRTHRLSQAMSFSVQAAADRERARAQRERVLPFAVHVSDLLDGLVGFLDAPVSAAARTALDDSDPARLSAPAYL